MMIPIKAFVAITPDELEKEVRCIKFEYVDEEADVGGGIRMKTGRKIKNYDTSTDRYHESTVIDEWKKEGAIFISDKMILHPHDGTAIVYIIVESDRPSRKKKEDSE